MLPASRRRFKSAVLPGAGWPARHHPVALAQHFTQGRILLNVNGQTTLNANLSLRIV